MAYLGELGKMKPTNLVEAEGHTFLLSEIVYIGPIFTNFGPDGEKKYFAVSLHSGICFYLDPLCRDDLLRRWREWNDATEMPEVDYSALAEKFR